MTSEKQTDGTAPTESNTAVSSGLRKVVLLTLAGVFFVLSVIGALLPGLPATPFLLLTSYFLVRSSPALNARLLQSRMFGPILVDWQVHGGVRNHVRWKAIAVVAATITLTIAFAGYSRSISAAIITLAFIGILVILNLPTANDRPRDEN